MITERLKFYADTDHEKNKYFCFKINSMFDLKNRLLYFMERMVLRAAWYECIEDGKVVSNEKIDLTQFVDYKDVIFIK